MVSLSNVNVNSAYAFNENATLYVKTYITCDYYQNTYPLF